MFGYKYKADALKWRAQEAENESKELKRKFKMTIEIELKDGSFKHKTIERESRMIDVGFLHSEYVVQLGSERLHLAYEELKQEAGMVGLDSNDGIFYPHYNIASIRNVAIVEVTT